MPWPWQSSPKISNTVSVQEVGAPFPTWLSQSRASPAMYGVQCQGFLVVLSCFVLSWSLYGWHLGTWTLALQEGKALFLAECSLAYQITDGFPSSWGIGLCSGDKRGRIAQLVWTRWSFLILPLSQKRVWPPGIAPGRAGAQTRNALGARCTRLGKMASLTQNQGSRERPAKRAWPRRHLPGSGGVSRGWIA